jgi:spore maturation protein CgeB
MQFVIFGLTVSSSWGNGHATIWRGLCKALAEKGHSVRFFEKDQPYYRRHRDLIEPPRYTLELYRQWDEIKSRVRALLSAADCAIVTSYCPDSRAACDLVLESSISSRIFYDLDTPVTLDVLQRDGHVDYIPEYGLGPFDLVLSYTGGDALTQLRSKLGAQRVAPLYGGVDPTTHKRVEKLPRFISHFSYLGTYAADRQAQLEQLFLQPARELPNRKFCIGGALYPTGFPWAGNVYFVRHLAPPEHPAFYSSSALTLNITRAAMADLGYCPSGRLFEAAACGTPIVSDWWQGLDQFFEPEKEILIARSTEDVIRAIHLSAEELGKLSQASQKRALAQHTSTNRAAELIGLIEGKTIEGEI